MSTLYVVEAGARLEKEYQRLLVTKDDEVIFRVPIERVSRVVLIGRVGATTAALHALLSAGIPLLLVNRSGRLLGRLSPPMPANLPLRRDQYSRDGDEAFCLNLAHAIVAGKLRNQRTLARRIARRDEAIDSDCLADLDSAVDRAASAADLAVLRGIEGQAARCFFTVYRQAFHAQWQFHKRTRRPPRDPVNTLLSLGYTLLNQNLMTALETAGLDPYLGYFHVETYGRPALALDLTEEFRTPVVDSLTLNLLSRGILGPDDFEPDPESGGISLTERGLREYLRQFNKKLESELFVRDLDRRISYRKLFEVQARRLVRVIKGKDESYRPFCAR
jgi:CRISPR-associated protein Cas1